jgi:hypothetical protein
MRIKMVKEIFAMVRQLAFISLLLACVMGIVSCDNSPPLERTTVRDTGSIIAEFHTENPENIQFPVKVLFALDCSLSMLSSDPLNPPDEPYGRRIAAVQRFLERYNTEDYPSVSFSILLWAGSVIDQTENGYGEPGYTRSTEELNRVLDNVRNESYTDYVGAVTDIREIVENDIMNTSYQESGENDLARSKYIVCFFSDGMPNTDAGSQLPQDIWDQVEALTEITEERGVGQFNFHSFFLSSLFRDASGEYITAYETERQYAENTLLGMASAGNGTFRDFASAEAIDFINFTDMSLTNAYKIKFIVAYNYNVLPGTDVLHLDSDGDGLTDEEEITRHGTDPQVRDTDDDGLSDYFEIQTQTLMDDGNMWPDPLVEDSSCAHPASGLWPDQDSDGLTDCEESIKGTWRFVADFDADYIPDGIEMAAGTNPFENLYTEDSDLDRTLDVFEIQNHTNVLTNDPKVQERYSYSYDLTDHGNPDPIEFPDLPQGIRRYSLRIDNISLMDTLGADSGGLFANSTLDPGDNVIRIYIAQVPEDRPNSSPVFRMAEVTINTLEDSSYTQTLGYGQFELID